MNLRKFKHDRADLLRQGEEIAAARNIDPRYKSRVVAVSMVLSGAALSRKRRNWQAPAGGRLANDWARTAGQEGAIWDNAPCRKKAMKEIEGKEECAGIRESAIFLCLPPYSPGLDPVEQA